MLKWEARYAGKFLGIEAFVIARRNQVWLVKTRSMVLTRGKTMGLYPAGNRNLLGSFGLPGPAKIDESCRANQTRCCPSIGPLNLAGHEASWKYIDALEKPDQAEAYHQKSQNP
jgi:hypothetical protein